jgi:hypothetical protein
VIRFALPPRYTRSHRAPALRWIEDWSKPKKSMVDTFSFRRVNLNLHLLIEKHLTKPFGRVHSSLDF